MLQAKTGLPNSLRIPRACVRVILVLSLVLMLFSLLEGQRGQGAPISSQTVSEQPSPVNPEGYPSFQTFQHLGLEGALIAAVIVLWKTLQTERAAATAILKSSTEALLTTAASNIELRRISEDSKKSDLEMASCLKDLVRTIALMNSGFEKMQTHYLMHENSKE